jgi:hypothetical protein
MEALRTSETSVDNYFTSQKTVLNIILAAVRNWKDFYWVCWIEAVRIANLSQEMHPQIKILLSLIISS